MTFRSCTAGKATPHEQPRLVRDESTLTVSPCIAAAASALRACSAAVRVGKTAMLRTVLTVLSFYDSERLPPIYDAARRKVTALTVPWR